MCWIEEATSLCEVAFLVKKNKVMAIVNVVSKGNSFIVNDKQFQKGALSWNLNKFPIIQIGTLSTTLEDLTVDGQQFATKDQLQTWADDNVFKTGGGSGGGAVESVTGNLVGGTSTNPTVDFPIGNNKQVAAYLDGDVQAMNINVEHLTDIGGFPSFANGVLTATAMNATAKTGLLSFVKFNNASAEAGTFPMYGTGGVLKVANAVSDDDAVNLYYLDIKFRGFDEIINVTANKILSIADAGFGRALVIDGTNLVMSLPSTVAGFTAGNVINLFNINTSPVEISNVGSIFNIVSNGDLKHISDKAYARLVYLGNNNFFLEGELTAI